MSTLPIRDEPKIKRVALSLLHANHSCVQRLGVRCRQGHAAANCARLQLSLKVHYFTLCHTIYSIVLPPASIYACLPHHYFLAAIHLTQRYIAQHRWICSPPASTNCWTASYHTTTTYVLAAPSAKSSPLSMSKWRPRMGSNTSAPLPGKSCACPSSSSAAGVTGCIAALVVDIATTAAAGVPAACTRSIGTKPGFVPPNAADKPARRNDDSVLQPPREALSLPP